MKKKIIAAVISVVILISSFVGASTIFGASYFPYTPIEFHDMNKMLFSERHFTTKISGGFPMLTDDWQYYYWCDFTPQYAADYTVDIKVRFPFKCEIYTADDVVVATAQTGEAKEEDGYYHFSLTHRLETGNTYYYKFAFNSGFKDGIGDFWVKFSSGESGILSSADNLHLTVHGVYDGYTYDINDYSIQQLYKDLQLVVVHKDSRVARWYGYLPHILDNVDVLINSADCQKELGTHTVYIHYLGYEAKATFNITGCLHEYVKNGLVYPEWNEQGYQIYECIKCGKTYNDYNATAEEIKPLVEAGLNSRPGDAEFNELADVNKDGIINARDVAIINRAYQNYLSPTALLGNPSEEN